MADDAPATPIPPVRVSVVLFDRFELLDVFGPVELLYLTPGVEIEYLGPARGPVPSSQGAEVIATLAYPEVQAADVLLVPGGMGTRPLATDGDFLRWLGDVGRSSRLVTSVCTGSALLAAAGLLEGYRATTNKRAYRWATGFGHQVEWVAAARWVHDRSRWTSSGVAAGMDMAAALIADLRDARTAQEVTDRAELAVHRDSTWDPFAAKFGLADRPTAGPAGTSPTVG